MFISKLNEMKNKMRNTNKRIVLLLLQCMLANRHANKWPSAQQRLFPIGFLCLSLSLPLNIYFVTNRLDLTIGKCEQYYRENNSKTSDAT